MEKVAAGLQPRFRFKAACWRKREGSCSGSGRLLEVCDCDCVCVIVSLCDCVCLYLCDCVCVIVFWEWEAPRAGEMKRIWRRWFASTQFVGRGPFPKIVLKVSTDCLLCPKETFSEHCFLYLNIVYVSEDCIKSFHRLCSVSQKNLSPNSVFCVLVRRLCSTQFVGLSIYKDCVKSVQRLCPVSQ